MNNKRFISKKLVVISLLPTPASTAPLSDALPLEVVGEVLDDGVCLTRGDILAVNPHDQSALGLLDSYAVSVLLPAEHGPWLAPNRQELRGGHCTGAV